MTNKIVIQGITNDGQKFRPSDWAERVSCDLSTFKNHKIHFSPMLIPSIKEGIKCLMLDPELEAKDPEAYQSVMEFAKINNLKICNQSELPNN